MFTKFASLESTEVLDLKGSATQAKTASLDKVSDFEDYRTEDGFLYVRLRAISSRVNKNNDGWPSVELAGGPDNWKRYASNAPTGFTLEASADEQYGYSTFLHKPVFVDHHNSDPGRARGVIVDAKLHVEDHRKAALDPYYSAAPDNHKPPTWVELLVEVDAKSFPRLAKAIVEGGKDSQRGIDGWSMGCNVEKTVCSICKNAATSPDDYCKHVRLKGAHFDTYDDMGRKTSRKAYEDCYGVQFFEISAVFDPADETALSKEVRSNVHKEAGIKVGENPPPQKDLTTAPEHVDPLRDDDVCPVCGSTLDEPQCKVCDYVKPPDGFDNPDLDKNHDKIEQMNQPNETAPDPNDPLAQLEGQPLRTQGQDWAMGPAQDSPTNITGSARVTNGMSGWHLTAKRINTVERPIKPSTPVSNEPKETVLSDQSKPTLTRTASDLIAAANKETTMERVAEAASGAPAVATPDKRIDVDGTGGIMDASNEQASKANKQVDVEGVGGTGVEGVEADSHDHVDHGDEHSKTTDDSGPTKTWSGMENQTDAVTRQPWPASSEGVKRSNDDKAFPDDDGGLSGGGKAVQGVKPVAESFGERQNVLEHSTSPANNSGPTKTWSGTDGNGVLKQQEPVTNEALVKDEDKVNLFTSRHLFAAFKLADQEVELGLIEKDEKYNRVAELQELTPEALQAESRVIARVKTAGIRRQATKQGGVGRVPSMRASKAVVAQPPAEIDDSALFI